MLEAVPDSPETREVPVGDFVFRPDTGEVSRHDDAHDTTRLPPQPARLLELLVDKQGELATREEIRQLLWPDTHVDFDQSLSFCVRQIRSALGDSAGESRYIETLPRRGYRLAPAARAPRAEAPSPIAAPSHGGPRQRLVKLALLAGVILVAALLLVGQLGGRDSAGPDPIRLAIMPFELAARPPVERLARISELLLVEFSNGWPDELDVIGPRSTAPYSDLPFPDMRGLKRDLDIDFVLNARVIDAEDESDLIVELIELDGGAHPWATYYSTTGDWRAIAADAVENTSAALFAPAD